MAQTVGELFQAWENFREERQVWEFLQNALEKTMRLRQQGEEAALIRMPDGRPVSDEAMVRVVAEITGVIAELEQSANRITTQQIDKE